jgi:hypothetical protein
MTYIVASRAYLSDRIENIIPALLFTTITYLSMALQPFVGPWQHFQFLDLLHSR